MVQRIRETVSAVLLGTMDLDPVLLESEGPTSCVAYHLQVRLSCTQEILDASFARLGQAGKGSLPSSGSEGILSASPASLSSAQPLQPLSTCPAPPVQKVIRETRG